MEGRDDSALLVPHEEAVVRAVEGAPLHGGVGHGAGGQGATGGGGGGVMAGVPEGL